VADCVEGSRWNQTLNRCECDAATPVWDGEHDRCVAQAVAASTVVAVVDYQRALLESRQGRAAKDELRRMFNERQADLNRRNDSLRAEQTYLQQHGQELDATSRQQREEAYRRAFAALTADFTRYQQELATRESELTSHIMEGVRAVVGQLRREGNYAAIADSSDTAGVPAGAIDVTNEVIARYDREHP
jgi:outer membrane protein